MYKLDDLLHLMARLRDPQHGCPWDLRQDYASIVSHTLEEAYEVADAIARRDFSAAARRAGRSAVPGRLLQPAGREDGHFDFAQVVDGITRKLVRPPPHVFPDGDLHGPLDLPRLDEATIKRRWEEIKAEERAEKPRRPSSCRCWTTCGRAAALSRAAKLQKRAANVGFDWADATPVVAKIQEELDEVREAMANGQAAQVAEEVGDLLFVMVNLARHLQVDAEDALRQANAKFERRFRFIEEALKAQDRSPQEAQSGGDGCPVGRRQGGREGRRRASVAAGVGQVFAGFVAAMPVRRSDRSDLDYRGHGPLLQKHHSL